jgi:fructokinase
VSQKSLHVRIGIDLGGTKIEAMALAPNGNECFRKRVPTPQGDYEGTVKAIAALVAAADDATKNAGTGQASVGVGIPGTISPATGLVKNANSVCLIGHALDKDLAAAVGRPVRLANDADCFALSEATDGAAANERTVFGAILGTGAGSGIVINKQLVGGPNAIAGEWGHNPLPWPRPEELPGPKCYCGLRGCNEVFISGTGLALDFNITMGTNVAATEVVARADAGDAAATAALDRYIDRLARATATIINVLDPHMIVCGGGMSNVARIYTDVPQLWPKYVFSDTVVTKLSPPKHGDSSGVRGAAWLWA